jgi:hypothetical protein
MCVLAHLSFRPRLPCGEVTTALYSRSGLPAAAVLLSSKRPDRDRNRITPISECLEQFLRTAEAAF